MPLHQSESPSSAEDGLGRTSFPSGNDNRENSKPLSRKQARRRPLEEYAALPPELVHAYHGDRFEAPAFPNGGRAMNALPERRRTPFPHSHQFSRRLRRCGIGCHGCTHDSRNLTPRT